MTPSRPAPSNRPNQSAAVGRSRVAGVRWTGGSAVAEDALEPRAPLPLRDLPQVLVVERQQVPGDEARRRRFGEHPDARFGGMDAQQQGLEIQGPVAGDDHLAVEHAARRQGRPQRRGQLREVAIERLQVTGLGVDLVAVAEDQRPEAVPLGFEQPAVVRRQLVDGLGQHRLERRLERKPECHAASVLRGTGPPGRGVSAMPHDRSVGASQRRAHGGPSDAHHPSPDPDRRGRAGRHGLRRRPRRHRARVSPPSATPSGGTGLSGVLPGRQRGSGRRGRQGRRHRPSDRRGRRRPRRRQDHPHRFDRSRGQRRPEGAPDGARRDRRARAAMSAPPTPATTATSRPPRSPTASRPIAGRDALDLLRGLNGLTTKVVTEHTEAVEVTGQVIDLQARIKNLQASEVALQGIAERATKISDVLEVAGPAHRRPRPDRGADGPAEGPQRSRRLRHPDRSVQRPGRGHDGRGQGLGTRAPWSTRRRPA